MLNPAFSLHVLLEKTYRTSNTYSDYDTTWMNIFEITTDDENKTNAKIALMESISSMLQLFVETKNLVEQNSKLNNEKNQKHLSTIGNAIYNINLQGSMAHFHETINEESLTALSYIADSIGFIYDLNEATIDSEGADTLIAEVDDLITSISESNLPKEAKFILIKNLNNILEALYKYKFLGADALKDALEQSLGSLILNKQTLSEVSNESSFSRFFNVLEHLNTLVSVGTSVKEIALPFLTNLIK